MEKEKEEEEEVKALCIFTVETIHINFKTLILINVPSNKADAYKHYFLFQNSWDIQRKYV